MARLAGCICVGVSLFLRRVESVPALCPACYGHWPRSLERSWEVMAVRRSRVEVLYSFYPIRLGLEASSAISSVDGLQKKISSQNTDLHL